VTAESFARAEATAKAYRTSPAIDAEPESFALPYPVSDATLAGATLSVRSCVDRGERFEVVLRGQTRSIRGCRTEATAHADDAGDFVDAPADLPEVRPVSPDPFAESSSCH
jgi:hypothetical protein